MMAQQGRNKAETMKTQELSGKFGVGTTAWVRIDGKEWVCHGPTFTHTTDLCVTQRVTLPIGVFGGVSYWWATQPDKAPTGGVVSREDFAKLVESVGGTYQRTSL